MQPTIRLIDPKGIPRATFSAPVTSEDLLRTALGMTPDDIFIVCITDSDEWSLAVLVSGAGGRLLSIGPKVPAVPRNKWSKVHRSMIETAWLTCVDEGWVTEMNGADAADDVPISFQGSR